MTDFENCYKQLITLIADQNVETPLTEKVTKIVTSHQKLNTHVAEHDFEQVHANGLRSFLLIIESFIEICCAELKKKRHKWKNRKRLEEVVDIFEAMSDLIEDIVLKERSLPNIEVTMQMISINKEKYFALAKLGHFWLGPEVQKSFETRNMFLAFGSNKWSGLFSRRVRQKLWARYACEANVLEYINSMRFQNSRYLAWKSKRGLAVERFETVQINAITKYEFLENGSFVEKNDANTITVQIVSHQENQKYDKIVVYHVHGGQAGVASKPKAFGRFLRMMARAMPGATIISPDYRQPSMYKYPSGLQDLFDCYMSLFGKYESNFKDVLGWKPKKIVVCGASAGANLTFALCRALHELKVDTPKFFVFCYPIVTPCLDNHAISHVTMMCDNVLAPGPFLNCVETYMPGNNLNFREDRRAWFRRDRPDIEARITEVKEKCMKDYFYNPTMVRTLSTQVLNMDIFRSTKMTLIASEFCPFLDQAIELAKKWPNPNVQFEIMRGLPHGWLTDDSGPSKVAIQLTIDKVNELIIG